MVGSALMKVRRRRMAGALFIVLLVTGVGVWARSVGSVGLAPTVVLKVDLGHPGHEFAVGAVGLSTEARELSGGRLGAERQSLIRLMRLLGPSVLRIGANSVDSSWWTSADEPSPPWATSTITPEDLVALRGLLAATGWKALLGVDLGHFEPARAADEAHYAQETLGSYLLGVEIGNEPNDFGGRRVGLRPPNYGVTEYLREAEAYRLTLNSLDSGVPVYGPALSLRPSWLAEMGHAAQMFAQITQHAYPIKTCSSVAPLTPQPTDIELLSPAVRQQENEILQTLAFASHVTGRSTRLGETNSVACKPTVDASPGFAGALWSLDWALRAVNSGVRGLNFHDRPISCSLYPESPICAAYDGTAANVGEVTAQSEYYGLLAARQLEGGRFVPARLTGRAPLTNFTSWATVAPNGTIRIAIDNLSNAGLVQPVSIELSGYRATDETLDAPSVQANTGVTLGDAQVTGSGRWHPTPVGLPAGRSVRVLVRPASAVIVTLRPTHGGKLRPKAG
jgi:hypothetical protein